MPDALFLFKDPTALIISSTVICLSNNRSLEDMFSKS